MMLDPSTLYYKSRRDPQDALRVRLRELAASRVRFGYRRLTVMLRREMIDAPENISEGQDFQ